MRCRSLGPVHLAASLTGIALLVDATPPARPMRQPRRLDGSFARQRDSARPAAQDDSLAGVRSPAGLTPPMRAVHCTTAAAVSMAAVPGTTPSSPAPPKPRSGREYSPHRHQIRASVAALNTADPDVRVASVDRRWQVAVPHAFMKFPESNRIALVRESSRCLGVVEPIELGVFMRDLKIETRRVYPERELRHNVEIRWSRLAAPEVNHWNGVRGLQWVQGSCTRQARLL
jgi:hypothetical protein